MRMRMFSTFTERCTLYPPATVDESNPYGPPVEGTPIPNVPCHFVSQEELIRKLGETYALYAGMLIIGPEWPVTNDMTVIRDDEPGTVYQIKKTQHPHSLRRDEYKCWQLLLT